jgi:Dolichyl-phosphate-mannose-protein mannosyltransferase
MDRFDRLLCRGHMMSSKSNYAKLSLFEEKLSSLRILNNPANFPLMLILAYLFFVIGRFIISLMVQNPLIPTDELAYKNMAYSYFQTLNFYNSQKLGYFVNLPNVLYPFLISPSFFLRDNFYVGIKLINALLITAAIFPAYFIAREFLSPKRSLLVSIIIVCLPSLNFINFVSTDGLNLTLYLCCLLFAYRTMVDSQLRNNVLFGFSLSLLFLNKPSAVGFAVGYLLANIIVCSLYYYDRATVNLKRILLSLAFSIAAFSTSFILINFMFKGTVFYDLGMYKAIPGVAGTPKTTYLEILSMILAHFSTFASLYFIPFIVTIAALYQLMPERGTGANYHKLSFIILGLSIFVVYVLFTSKFMVTIYNQEHFQRLHARYHFMTYAFFIISFVVFADSINWNVQRKIVLFIVFLAIGLLNYYYFFPRYVMHGLTVFDNPDLSWYVHPAGMKKIIFSLSVISVITLVTIKKGRFPTSFIFVFIAIMLFANIGEIRNIYFYDELTAAQVNNKKHFIRGTIIDLDASVVLVDSALINRLETAFWFPYNYKGVLDLPKGSTIRKEMIPAGTQYIVLFDDYNLDFPVNSLGTKSDCTILSLNENLVTK